MFTCAVCLRIAYLDFPLRNARGWHALFHSDCEKTGAPGGGHGFSVDGKTWTLHPHNAYGHTIEMVDGTTWSCTRRERPKLILDDEGRPTHLLNGVGISTTTDRTFTFVQPIAGGR